MSCEHIELEIDGPTFHTITRRSAHKLTCPECGCFVEVWVETSPPGHLSRMSSIQRDGAAITVLVYEEQEDRAEPWLPIGRTTVQDPVFVEQS